MCIFDVEMVDVFIKDCLGVVDWKFYLKNLDLVFVNVLIWGLMFIGKVIGLVDGDIVSLV